MTFLHKGSNKQEGTLLHKDTIARKRKEIWKLHKVPKLPGFVRIERFRIGGATAGKIDVEYTTPFPQMWQLRSMRQMIYFHPDIDWRYFNYRTGELGTRINHVWQDRNEWMPSVAEKLEKMRADFIRKTDHLARRVERKLRDRSEFDVQTWTPRELTYWNRDNIQGRVPSGDEILDKMPLVRPEGRNTNALKTKRKGRAFSD